MRLNFALIYSFLSASAVLARRNDSSPRRSLDQQATNSTTTNIYYNRVLSGGLFEAYNGTVNYVTSTFSVPSASASSQDETGAYFLVGMGSLKGDTAVFGGINLVMVNDTLSYTAFSWSAPDLPNHFNLTVSPRDDISISINTTSATTAIVTIENLTTHQCRSTALYVPSVPRQVAGCFVADRAFLDHTASSVDLAEFGVVTFTDVKLNASTTNVTGPDTAVIQVDQKNLTSVSVDGNSITITQLKGIGLGHSSI